MAAKVDWVNGNTVDADALNTLGGEVNDSRFVDVRDHIISGTTVDFGALVTEMESTGLPCRIPAGEWTVSAAPVLMNAASSTCIYRFVGDAPGSARIKFPSGMVDGDFLFGVNVDASGAQVSSTFYPHPEVIFENIAFYGTASPLGTVLRVDQRGCELRNVRFHDCKNGVVTSGYCDRVTLADVYGRDVSGWMYQQTELGDSLVVSGFNADDCGGLSLSKMHGGKLSGLLGGWHRCEFSDVHISGSHLEGDGDDAASQPILTVSNSRVQLHGCIFNTRPDAPAILVDDNEGASEWKSALSMGRGTYFQQRLDDPGSDVGDRLGVAVNITTPGQGTRLHLEDVRARVYRQNATVSSPEIMDLAPHLTTPNTTALEIGLLSAINANRPLLAGVVDIRYRNGAWELVTPALLGNLRTSRASSGPVWIYAAADDPMTAGWTTLTADTYYYKAYTVNPDGLATQATAEQTVTTTSGNPVPKLMFDCYQSPCTLVVLRGTTTDTYTHWAQLYVAEEYVTFYDQGDAVGGSAWSDTGVPTPPTANATRDGVVIGGQGRRIMFGTAAPTAGAWAAGDQMWNNDADTDEAPGWICTTAGTPGIWTALTFAVTAADLGLGNVDNTADSAKSVAEAAVLTTPRTINNVSFDGSANVSLPSITAADYMPAAITTMPRHNALQDLSTTSQQLLLQYIYADKDLQVTALTAYTGNAAAAATPSLVRMGIYSVDGSNNLSLIGSTPNDTTLFASTYTKYTKALSVATDLTWGTRYAFALLIVSSAGMPAIKGCYSLDTDQPPRLAGLLAGQSDLPESLTDASLSYNQTPRYMKGT